MYLIKRSILMAMLTFLVVVGFSFSDTKVKLTLNSEVYTFDGAYTDKEDNTIYLRARNFSPIAMRFISQDSYGLFNRYRGFDNDPVSKVDKSGHNAFKWMKKHAGTMSVSLGGALSFITPFLSQLGKTSTYVSYNLSGILTAAGLLINMTHEFRHNKGAFWGNTLGFSGLVLTSATWSYDSAVLEKAELKLSGNISSLKGQGDELPVLEKKLTSIKRKRFIFNLVGNFTDNTLANAGIAMQSGNTKNITKTILLGMPSALILAGSSAYLSHIKIWQGSASRAFLWGSLRGAVAQATDTLVRQGGSAKHHLGNYLKTVTLNAALGGMAGGALYAGTNKIFSDTRIGGIQKFGAQTYLSSLWQFDLGPVEKYASKDLHVRSN